VNCLILCALFLGAKLIRRLRLPVPLPYVEWDKSVPGQEDAEWGFLGEGSLAGFLECVSTLKGMEWSWNYSRLWRS